MPSDEPIYDFQIPSLAEGKGFFTRSRPTDSYVKIFQPSEIRLQEKARSSLAPRIEQYKFNEMPIETSVYRIQSLAKMIRPKANIISVPILRSRALAEKNDQYIKDNILQLKNHFRKQHTTKINVLREDKRLPLERFEQEMNK